MYPRSRPKQASTALRRAGRPGRPDSQYVSALELDQAFNGLHSHTAMVPEPIEAIQSVRRRKAESENWKGRRIEPPQYRSCISRIQMMRIQDGVNIVSSRFYSRPPVSRPMSNPNKGLRARRCLYGEGFFVGKRDYCLDIVGQPIRPRPCFVRAPWMLNIER